MYPTAKNVQPTAWIHNLLVSNYSDCLTFWGQPDQLIAVTVTNSRFEGCSDVALQVKGSTNSTVNMRLTVANSTVSGSNKAITATKDSTAVYLNNVLMTDNAHLTEGPIYTFGDNPVVGGSDWGKAQDVKPR